MTKRISSGIQPTSNVHLGNYLGALKNWVILQDTRHYECLYGIMDLHAITVPQDPELLKRSTREIAATMVAIGMDPMQTAIYAQSDVPQHAYLSWILGTITQIGKLNRMTQFKDKAGKDKEKAGLGLYSYPVLMAADILLYHATHVPVGEDQVQHIELARDIASTFNHRFGDVLTMPEAVLMPAGARIMSLRDGTQKMSKSAESDMTRINLTDDADRITEKIRKAKTDMGSVPATDIECEGRPEAKNLLTIYACLTDHTLADVMDEHGGKTFSQFKESLTEVAVVTLSPLSTRLRDLLKDPAEIDRILTKGGERAREIAAPTLKQVKDAMGFWHA